MIGNPWRMHRLRYELAVAEPGPQGSSEPAVTMREGQQEA